MKPAVSFLVVLLAVANGAHALSPPWWVAANTILAGLAPDKFSNATVKDAGNRLQITVVVATSCPTPGRRLSAVGGACMKSPQAAALKAAALSTLLAAKVKTANAELAGTKLAVAVIQGGKVVKPGALPSKPDAVATLLNRALLGNGYFDKVSRQPVVPGGPTQPFAIFHPKVAQIYVDDISQVDGLQTFTAAQLMDEAFDIAANGVNPTTDRCTPAECIVTA